MKKRPFINLTDAQMKDVVKLKKEQYVAANVLQCAHRCKDIALVKNSAEKLFDINQRMDDFFALLVKNHCEAAKEQKPCHFQFDESGRRIWLRWECLEQHDGQ